MTLKISDLRCIHRHTIQEHPQCFSTGKVKWPDAETFRKLSGEAWYKYPGYRIGYLDIESDGLKADFSTMLTWCIKQKDGDVDVDFITKEDLFDGTYDRKIVESCVETLRGYSIIVTYNGTNFDIPYLRSKCLHYGIEFPSYAELYHFDLYFLVKSKLNLSRKSLANVCDYLGIEGKTDIDKEIWRRAKYGDPEAIQGVLSHNIPDCEILEKLHNKIESFQKFTKRSI